MDKMTTIIPPILHEGEVITPTVTINIPKINRFKHMYRKHLDTTSNPLQQIRCDVLEDHEWIPYKAFSFDVCKYGCGTLRKDIMRAGIRKFNALMKANRIIFPR